MRMSKSVGKQKSYSEPETIGDATLNLRNPDAARIKFPRPKGKTKKVKHTRTKKASLMHTYETWC